MECQWRRVRHYRWEETVQRCAQRFFRSGGGLRAGVSVTGAFATGVLTRGVYAWPAGTSSRTIGLEQMSAVRQQISPPTRG